MYPTSCKFRFESGKQEKSSFRSKSSHEPALTFHIHRKRHLWVLKYFFQHKIKSCSTIWRTCIRAHFTPKHPLSTIPAFKNKKKSICQFLGQKRKKLFFFIFWSKLSTTFWTSLDIIFWPNFKILTKNKKILRHLEHMYIWYFLRMDLL